MGWCADRNAVRRERVVALVRKGYSNNEIYAQGYGPTVVASARKETGIENPGDLLSRGDAVEGARRAGVRGRSRHRLFGKAARDKDSREWYVDSE